MKERIYKSEINGESLIVYPHVPDDSPPIPLAGNVEGMMYWDEAGKKLWGVRLNIGYRMPMTKEQSEELIAAINRCWEWIAERQVEVTK